MSDTSVLAILASVGIVLAGSVSVDAAALAGAIQQAEPSALIQFVRDHPDSPLAPDALLLAAQVSNDRTTDSATSGDNPALACKLEVKREGGKAVVTWDVTGAAKSISLHPIGLDRGEGIPLVGTKTVSFDKFIRISLTVKDAAGHEISCSVILHSTDVDLNGSQFIETLPVVPTGPGPISIT